jgi:molybdate transport repressor ModE-like protein
MSEPPHPHQRVNPAAPDRTVASAYRADRLRLRHLRLLDLVDRGGSLGSAARGLGVSQPAATLLLRELETVFAATLVERDARGARLTAAGRYALGRLTIALASVARAVDAARTAAIEPPLRLGCIQVAGVGELPAALARLDAAGTLGRLELREGRARELLAALCAGELDCVIGWIDESLAEGVPVAELAVEPLRYGRMQVVAATSHPLAGRRAPSVAELARWRWIVPPPGSRTHAAFLRLFLQDGVPAPPVAVECAALHTMLRIVGATRLLAVAPDAAVAHYAELGLVAPLKGPRLRLDRNEIAVVTRRDSDALPAVRLLRKALLAGRAAAARPLSRARSSPA